MTREAVVARLLEQPSYAEQAGIRLRDEPAPLWQLLVLSLLLSARIRSEIAVDAARELFDAGGSTPHGMGSLTWQERVDALGRGSYRRYDERTATQLGDAVETLQDRWRGDLRRLHEASSSAGEVEQALQEFTGIGPAGAAIFCREVQATWTDLAPYVDDLAARGAEALGLPHSPAGLGSLVGPQHLPRLVAGCVRAARSETFVAEVLAAD